MNAFDPTRMSAADRLDDIDDILAAGLMRLCARKSSRQSAGRGENSLDCAGDPSGLDKPISHRGVLA
jgi:hypothetical protein